MTAAFPLVKVEGAPRQRGEAYGRQARDRVQASLDTYLPMFAEHAGLDWPTTKRLAREFGTLMAAYDPETMAEIEGIADGAGQEVEAIVALNARSELLYWGQQGAAMSKADGCTTAACLSETTADGHVYLCQNWDWLPGCRDAVVVVASRPATGRSLLTIQEAGVVARSGLNDAGLGVVGNSLACDRDGGESRMGVPVPLIRRRMLASAGLGRAVGHVIRAQRAHSLNYLVAEADGEAIDLETTPDEVFTLDATDGLLTHANHFQSLAARSKFNDTLIARWPDSLLRERRIAKHLDRRRGNIRVDDLQCVLRDHYGLPEAICRHETDQSDDPNPIVTVASVIMDLDARRMWVAPGPPCQNDYREYAL